MAAKKRPAFDKDWSFVFITTYYSIVYVKFVVFTVIV